MTSNGIRKAEEENESPTLESLDREMQELEELVGRLKVALEAALGVSL